MRKWLKSVMLALMLIVAVIAWVGAFMEDDPVAAHLEFHDGMLLLISVWLLLGGEEND